MEVQERVWIDCYSQDAILVTSRQDSPGNKRRCPAMPADLKIIADMVDPATEPALKDPPTQVAGGDNGEVSEARLSFSAPVSPAGVWRASGQREHRQQAAIESIAVQLF